MRKKQRADQEAEDRKRLAAKNLAEGQKRFRDHRKRHGRVVPPWVEEHPDVFNDAEFSITQTDSSVYFDLQRDETVSSAMEVSGGDKEEREREEGVVQKPVAWVSPCN